MSGGGSSAGRSTMAGAGVHHHGMSGPAVASDRVTAPRSRCAATLGRRAVGFYAGPGASGTAASMAGHVRGLAARGVEARAIDLPVKLAETAVPAFRAIVPDGPGSPGADGRLIAVGGQSYGGRVASL